MVPRKRKPKNPKDAQTEAIMIRVTPVELAALKRMAGKEKLAAMCRRIVLAAQADDPVLAAQQVEMGKRIGELRRKRRRVPQIG